MVKQNINLPEKQMADFCRRWRIGEFVVFGSVLRADFSPDSDFDVLVTFAPEASWSLLDHLRMKQEFTALLNRKIDLFSKRAVEQSHNWMRRQEILNTAEVVYARDKLIHGYDIVDLHEVWQTALVNMPDLLSGIEPLLPKQE